MVQLKSFAQDQKMNMNASEAIATAKAALVAQHIQKIELLELNYICVIENVLRQKTTLLSQYKNELDEGLSNLDKTGRLSKNLTIPQQQPPSATAALITPAPSQHSPQRHQRHVRGSCDQVGRSRCISQHHTGWQHERPDASYLGGAETGRSRHAETLARQFRMPHVAWRVHIELVRHRVCPQLRHSYWPRNPGQLCGAGPH